MITKIHDKKYDLTDFKHPGGKLPLTLINKKDGTCLFELYHPVSDRKKLSKILSKYEIADENITIEDNDYDFKNFSTDPFTVELREKVYNYFLEISIKRKCTLIEATKMTPLRKFEILSLFFICVFSFLLFKQNSIIGLFLFPISLWLVIANVYHDAAHFAFSTYKWLELVIMPLFPFHWPPMRWYIDHNYNHHSYPNIIEKDQDLWYEYETYPNKAESVTPERAKYWINKSYIFNFFEQLIFSVNINDKYETIDNPNKIYSYQNIVYIFIKLLFWKTLFIDNLVRNGLITAIIYTLIPLYIFFKLYDLFIPLNHYNINCFDYNLSNLYKHQIITAQNFSIDNYFFRIFSGYINLQIEHHLFPSVNSCHLLSISKIVKELCKKYKIHYQNVSFIEAYKNVPSFEEYMEKKKNMIQKRATILI